MPLGLRLPSPRLAPVLSALLALVASTTPLNAQTDTQTRSKGTGRMVDASTDITAFAPAEDYESVDAARVNLRQVLEDLGPVARTWYLHTTTLADPFFEGRVASTRGMEIAGEYIAFYLEQYGLDPAFPAAGADDGAWTSYFQPFDIDIREGPRLTTVDNARLAIDDHEAVYEKDFVIFGNSGTGEVTGPVTFVGYAIAEGENGYSSFNDDTDLTGCIALVLRYEPLDEAGHSRWSDEGFSRHASLRRKLQRVAALGAAGIIIVNPPGAAEGRTGLDSLERSSQFGASLGIPVAQVTQDLASDLLIQADPGSRDLMTLRRLADKGKVTTVDLDDAHRVTLAATVDRRVRTRTLPGRNCGGVLRGRGALADQWLVISAHYDHVGKGQLHGAMAENRGKLHPGADDNASGTAGVLVLAQRFVRAYADAPADADLRSILFLAFDGEEQGLLGSRHFSDHPTIDPAHITADLNFDMIGRLRSNTLLVLGGQTGVGLEDILRPHIEASGMTVAVAPSSSGRSDEANFIRIHVPGLHFFTGMTSEYHTPEDKFYTVNPAGAAKVIDLAYDVALDLVTRDDQLVYTEPGATRTAGRDYARVRLGIRPGLGDDLDTGVLVESVSLDTSAADAGIRKGDILLTWDGDELASVRNLFEHLQEHKPGDVVRMEIKRGEEIIVVDVTLKAGNEQ